MTRVSCNCCHTNQDVRQMTNCRQCNSYICQQCAGENGELCDACFDMDGGMPE